MIERIRLTWLVTIRLVVVSILFASTTFLYFKDTASFGPVTYRGTLIISILTALFSLALLLIARFFPRYSRYFIYLLLVWDIFYATVLIILTGGIVSPFSFLFFIIIIGVSITLSRREAILCASLSSIIYGALIDLQYYGKLESIGLSQSLALQFGAPYLFYSIFINMLAYFLAALLSGYLAERLRSSEHALAKKVVDYEELERLNSAIVANLDSGLLTLNNQGRIRVINRYAAEMTGTTQEEAYDAGLAEIMPLFSGLQFADGVFNREEISFLTPEGAKRICGYKVVPIFDSKGSKEGLIINFKDLTDIKRLEELLKRSDRLAAIGELAARIAHEIRNPLAAISGSVQLMAQGERVDAGDLKLLEIVQRETARLNRLITDFLAYARPSQPQFKSVNVGLYLAELAELVRQDERFAKTQFVTECPNECSGCFDAGLIQQALWNLIQNAREAVGEGGEIRVSAVAVGERHGVGSELIIEVTDTGGGIPIEHIPHIFEPFYTTKPSGTGLGLATVYRIVDAHNGTIDVASGTDGTRFTICLPMSAAAEGVKGS